MGKGVSVVIRTYERPNYLQGAVETALQQTHDPVELVVVDDGSSTEYAPELAASYDQARCIRHEENRGSAAAMNTGIDAADREFVAFLDDDDRWHETKLERQIEALTANSEAGLATCLMVSATPEGQVVSCQSSAPTGDLSRQLLVRNVIGSPSRVLVRRDVVAEHRFDETLTTKNDWDFYLRVCQKWSVVLVPEQLYIRTLHPSLSSDPRDARRDNRTIIRKHERTIRARGCWEETMAAYHADLGRKFIETRERSEARHHLRKAASLHPTRKRLTLLAFTVLPWAAFSLALRVKRANEAYRHVQIQLGDLSRSIPGFPPGSPETI